MNRLDRAILLLGLVSDRVGLALLYIVFGPLARELGLDELQFGILIASANVTLGLASPWWGRRSQQVGRRPVFVIGLAGYAAGFLLLGAALAAGLSGWLAPAPLFVALLVVRLAYGLFAAGTQPAATAYVADVTAAEDRARGMAFLGVAAGVGTLLGPALGGLLVAVGPILPLYVAAAMAAVASVLAWVGLRESLPAIRDAGRGVAGSRLAPLLRAGSPDEGRGARKSRLAPLLQAASPASEARNSPAEAAEGRLRFTDPRLFPYLAGWCVVVFVLTAVQTVTAFYLEDSFAPGGRAEVARAVSVTFFALGAAMLFVQAVVLQRLRVAPDRLVAAGFVLFGIGLVLLAAAPHPAIAWLAFAMVGAGFGTLTPGLNAGASVRVGMTGQGAVAGLLAAAPVAGMIAGPMAGTALYALDPVLPLALGATLCLALGLAFGIRHRRFEAPSAIR